MERGFRMLTGRDIAAERARFSMSQPDMVKIVDGLHLQTLVNIEKGVVKLTQEEYQRLIDVVRAEGAKAAPA